MRQPRTIRFKALSQLLCALIAAFVVLLVPALAFAEDADLEALQQDALTAQMDGIPMFRLYNPNSGEHFYTADDGESAQCVKRGWQYEGIGWYSTDQGAPVYRLYNPNAGDHHYTANPSERDMLVWNGWKYEGIGWQSVISGGVPVFREYNPNMWRCNHNYTTSWDEHIMLLTLGWRDEGIAWYGVPQ